MTTVYKYPLRVDDLTTVNLPIGARVLHVDVQNDEPQLWALVDPRDALVRPPQADEPAQVCEHGIEVGFYCAGCGQDVNPARVRVFDPNDPLYGTGSS